MQTALLISIIGAVVSIGVSLIGALLANRNNIILQTRKLKEEHYISFIEALHYLMAYDKDDRSATTKYVLTRDKMFLIASEEVIIKLFDYEKKGVATPDENHNFYLTELVKAIRNDLKIRDTNFPLINFKK